MTGLFEITASLQAALQAIDFGRDQIAGQPLPRLQAERLRLRARVRAAYFSAWLDGNGLSVDEAAEVLIDGHKFSGREGDILQVKRTYQALEQIEAWAQESKPLDEKKLLKQHAVLAAGRKAKPSAYRPDPAIPARMGELFGWLNQAGETPALLAGYAHFQVNAIQPFSELNARLARSLASWVLYHGGYPLLRYAALEEAFAADLPAYQAAAALSELTPWMEYFTTRLAAAYGEASLQVSQAAGASPQPPEAEDELPRPDKRALRVLRLFETQAEISPKDVMRLLALPPNPAREQLESWVRLGWLVKAGARYRLSPILKQNFQQILEQDH